MYKCTEVQEIDRSANFQQINTCLTKNTGFVLILKPTRCTNFSNLLLLFFNRTLHMRREEKPTRCHCKLYCIYDTLNMFRALLSPSPGALDYMYAIAAYGAQCLAAGCRESGAGQQGVHPGRGMLQHPSSWMQVLRTIGGNSINIV